MTYFKKKISLIRKAVFLIFRHKIPQKEETPTNKDKYLF